VAEDPEEPHVCWWAAFQLNQKGLPGPPPQAGRWEGLEALGMRGLVGLHHDCGLNIKQAI